MDATLNSPITRADEPVAWRGIGRYFTSGWAFFLPYLATYLFFHWVGLPTNPTKGSHINLLHTYWILHAIHLSLAVMIGARAAASVGFRAWRPRIVPHLASWLLLGLLFAIPGIYLEWPGDPWEHLGRITEWAHLQRISEHTIWYRASYFLPYTLVAPAPGEMTLPILQCYYCGVCLVLSWQYYLLGRAVGLTTGASFAFVVVQALFFGNNVFSFYRYYGLSSSILAQIAVVALVRILLTAASKECKSGRIMLVVQVCAAGALLAFNHIQGIATAGLCGCAVAVWKAIEMNRRAILWFAGLVLMASGVAVSVFHDHPSINDFARREGWLNAWYGFGFLASTSPAQDRVLQILGLVGMVNVACGCWLLRRNSVVGWLTVLPVIALLTPALALPFTFLSIRTAGEMHIVTFQRMLFAIPYGLAVVAVAAPLLKSSLKTPRQLAATATLIGIPIVVALIPIERPYYNRLPSSVLVVPNDLAFEYVIQSHIRGPGENQSFRDSINSSPTTAALRATSGFKEISERRAIGAASSQSIDNAIKAIESRLPRLAREGLSGPPDVERTLTNTLSLAPAAVLVKGVHPWNNEGMAVEGGSTGVCEVFSRVFTTVDASQNYELECLVRSLAGDDVRATIAVAWYDDRHNLLPAHVAGPEGAGSPQGWSNGTFSYIGEISGKPNEWYCARYSFGPRHGRAIPKGAKFMRIGALLNSNNRPDSRMQIANLQIRSKDGRNDRTDGHFPMSSPIVSVIPRWRSLTTTFSLLGQASGHWPARQVAIDYAGGPELSRFIAAKGATVRNWETYELFRVDPMNTNVTAVTQRKGHTPE